MSGGSYLPAAESRATPLGILTEWATSTRAFKRNKVTAERKVVAAALCNSGYSYRAVADMLGGISYIGARDAYFSFLTSLPKEERRDRAEVAIDGMDVAMDGKEYHLWLARDVGSGELMAFQASPGASAEDGARFLASVAGQCSNKPLLRLGSPPYAPRGLVNLDLYFHAGGSQSLFERIGRMFHTQGGGGGQGVRKETQQRVWNSPKI